MTDSLYIVEKQYTSHDFIAKLTLKMQVQAPDHGKASDIFDDTAHVNIFNDPDDWTVESIYIKEDIL